MRPSLGGGSGYRRGERVIMVLLLGVGPSMTSGAIGGKERMAEGGGWMIEGKAQMTRLEFPERFLDRDREGIGHGGGVGRVAPLIDGMEYPVIEVMTVDQEEGGGSTHGESFAGPFAGLW